MTTDIWARVACYTWAIAYKKDSGHFVAVIRFVVVRKHDVLTCIACAFAFCAALLSMAVVDVL